MVRRYGLYFIIFIIDIVFNRINIYFNMLIILFYIINIFIFYIINNILISYDCMYVKCLRALLIDRALLHLHLETSK